MASSSSGDCDCGGVSGARSGDAWTGGGVGERCLLAGASFLTGFSAGVLFCSERALLGNS